MSVIKNYIKRSVYISSAMPRFRLINHIATFFIAIIIVAFTSCEGSKSKSYKIGVSQCSGGDWREKMNEEIKRELLFYDDAAVEILTADDDSKKQIDDIRYFIDNNFDIILVAPNEADAITPIISKAYEKGIPVIIFDRRINGDSYTSYMELDNIGIGKAAAEYAASILGPDGGEVVEITGLPSSTPAQERHKGFVDELAKHKSLIFNASLAADWNEEIAYQLADSILKFYPSTKLIYAHNDPMAVGASRKFKEKGRDDIKILGTDAAPQSGMPAVKAGLIDATCIYPTEGHRLVKTAMAILHGEPFEKVVHVPSLTFVDSTNADILIRQYELLRDETEKVEMMEDKNDELLSRHRSQSTFLILMIIFAVILVALLILVFIAFIKNRRLQGILREQNSSLEEERDKQKELYKKLDKATNSKLTFFTNVSHDLRTPLTLISEPVNQVSTRDYLNTKDRQLMKLAVKNVGILRRLIDDILNFQRHEDGRDILSLSEVPITSLLREWTEMFRPVAEERKIKLSLETDYDPDMSMAFDVEKMERVFFNLVSNAFRYTSDKGKISIKSKIIDNNFILSVSDTGIGIPENDLKKIFDNFYQVDNIRPKGSGIGLAVTKLFVELHGGSISVNSEVNKGSEFIITIPVRHTENKSDISSAFTQKEIETYLDKSDKFIEEKTFTEDKPLVLVIDDNEDIRSMLSNLLEDEYNVMAAPDGDIGIKLAVKYVPDLIICDIMMPGKDGIECCDILKKNSSTSHIPVLILTACKLDEQRIQSYESGADGFISKPFQGELLISRCKNLIENRKRIRDIYGHDNIESEGKQFQPQSSDLKSLENEFYGKFITIIKTRYADTSLNTETLAEQLNLGPAQLTRKIKALTNFTPVEILRNYRLEKAKKMLLSTEKTINEIAYGVGFASPAYLTKCFREAFGRTPTEYRENPD